MPKAVWKGATLAQSDQVVIVEGNQYFPPDALERSHFKDSPTESICPWKGTASYYTVVVNGEENRDAAWFYPAPKHAAKEIKDHVAFWKGVEIRP